MNLPPLLPADASSSELEKVPSEEEDGVVVFVVVSMVVGGVRTDALGRMASVTWIVVYCVCGLIGPWMGV